MARTCSFIFWTLPCRHILVTQLVIQVSGICLVFELVYFQLLKSAYRTHRFDGTCTEGSLKVCTGLLKEDKTPQFGSFLKKCQRLW